MDRADAIDHDRIVTRLLDWLGLAKAANFVAEIDATAPDNRIEKLAMLMPSSFGQRLISHRHLLFAVALNTPGNSLLGGGGGLAFIAGASRLFSFWSYVAVVLCAVAPAPLFFYLI